MKLDYISCLSQACVHSKELDLIPKHFNLSLNQFDLSESFCDYLSVLESHLKNNEGVIANCFKVSHWLKDLVDDFYKMDCALITVGHVIHNNKKEFYQTKDIRLKQLELKQVSLPIKLHCWITLPGGIILDPTYLTMKYESMRGRILLKKNEDMPEGFFFYPEFIGSEYMIRTGIPIDM